MVRILRRGGIAAIVAVAASTLIAGPAAAAPADRLDPVQVGEPGDPFRNYAVIGDAVYGSTVSMFSRVDGPTPQQFGSSFGSIDDVTAFAGSLHFIYIAEDNSLDVIRLGLDGTSSTSLDDGSMIFLGGVGDLATFDGVLYATSSTVGGAIAFSTVDGITWVPATLGSPTPTPISEMVSVGDLLYADGSILGVRALYAWDGATWTTVSGLTGGLTEIDAGVDRLLVGTSEGLFEVVGTTATELDGTVSNPRSMAEFDGEVWWVDDSNELRSIDGDGVRTSHDVGTGALATGRLFATSTALYYNVRDDSRVDSTFRIDLRGDQASPGEVPELAATGSRDTLVLGLFAAIMIAIVGTAALARSRRTSEPTVLR